MGICGARPKREEGNEERERGGVIGGSKEVVKSVQIDLNSEPFCPLPRHVVSALLVRFVVLGDVVLSSERRIRHG